MKTLNIKALEWAKGKLTKSAKPSHIMIRIGKKYTAIPLTSEVCGFLSQDSKKMYVTFFNSSHM